MTVRLRGCRVFVGLAVLAAPPAVAQTSLSLASEISIGAYGETTDTELIYTALSAGYVGDDWSVDVTLPWVQITGPGVFLGPDLPLGRERPSMDRSPGDRSSGLADLSLLATRTLAVSESGATRLDLTGRISLPTGDEGAGLSGGTVRGASGLELSQDAGAWTLFAGGGYSFNGGDFESGPYASAGLVRYFGGVSAGAAYDFSTAASPDLEDASEVSVWLGLPTGGGSRLQFYGVAGLSDGSPDTAYGARLVFSR